jgi:hypothetical protein
MINFNLSLKYYILPYGTNIGGSKDLKQGANKESYPPLAGWAKRHF